MSQRFSTTTPTNSTQTTPAVNQYQRCITAVFRFLSITSITNIVYLAAFQTDLYLPQSHLQLPPRAIAASSNRPNIQCKTSVSANNSNRIQTIITRNKNGIQYEYTIPPFSHCWRTQCWTIKKCTPFKSSNGYPSEHELARSNTLLLPNPSIESAPLPRFIEQTIHPIPYFTVQS